MEKTQSEKEMEPQVYFDPMVYKKIMHWVHKSTVEVSGLGKIRLMEDGSILVISAHLIEQENSSSETEMQPDALTKAMYELRDEPGELKFWWHSHVNMGVFWSGTDIATMKMLGQHGWFLSTVFNKRNEFKTAIFQKAPYKMFKDDIATGIWNPVDESLSSAWDKEFEEKCKEKRWSAMKPAWQEKNENGSKKHKSYLDLYNGDRYDDDDDYYGNLAKKINDDEKSEKVLAITQNKSEADIGNEAVSDSLQKLLVLDDDFFPEIWDANHVYLTNGEFIDRFEYKRRFKIDVTEPDVRKYLKDCKYDPRTPAATN